MLREAPKRGAVEKIKKMCDADVLQEVSMRSGNGDQARFEIIRLQCPEVTMLAMPCILANCLKFLRTPILLRWICSVMERESTGECRARRLLDHPEAEMQQFLLRFGIIAGRQSSIMNSGCIFSDSMNDRLIHDAVLRHYERNKLHRGFSEAPDLLASLSLRLAP